MGTLYHLDGRPQTWDELHAALRAYYDARPAFRPPARRCAQCIRGSHRDCSGAMSLVPGLSGYGGATAPCGCWCRKERRDR